MNATDTKKLRTACNRDCPDACGIIATVENNQVIRIGGDPDHPVTQGFLCKRTSRYLKRQYSPARVTEPMIRDDEGNWKPVSLDTALDLVAERMLKIRETSGPAAIMNYRCGGSMGIMKNVTEYFFQEFGPTTTKSGDICAGAGDAAQELDFGKADSNDIFDLYNAKNIILWGKNVYVSQVHLLPILKKAKSQGTRLILIDPVRHRTADLADQFIQIKPGGDGALALGMAAHLYKQNKFDPEVANYCDNLDTFQQLIESQSVEDWAEMAGVNPDQLIQLANEYADGPSTILAGWGMQRRRNGAAIIRSIDALAAVSGNIGQKGASVSYYFARKDAYDVSFLNPDAPPRRIPEPILGRGILEAQDPPIEMVFITAANPVATLPESETTERALQEKFTVVVDCFMTDTAQCADVFIPTTTMLEDNDLLGAYGHHYLSEVRPVVQPPKDCFTDYEILQRLGKRLGVGGRFDDDIETWKRRLIAKCDEHGLTLESFADSSPKSPVAPSIVFENRQFPTSTGRVNLLMEYTGPQPNIDADYPLRLMAISTDEAQASQWQPEEQEGLATVTVHPNSATGLTEGQAVFVESKLNRLQAIVKLDASQRFDVALMDKGGWLSSGRCPNLLTTAEMTDAGQGAVYYETPVRIVAS